MTNNIAKLFLKITNPALFILCGMFNHSLEASDVPVNEADIWTLIIDNAHYSDINGEYTINKDQSNALRDAMNNSVIINVPDKQMIVATIQVNGITVVRVSANDVLLFADGTQRRSVNVFESVIKMIDRTK